MLADALSGARRGGAAIAHYDLLLRDPAFADAHRPGFVFRVGDLPTSKPLRSWLASLPDAVQIAFDPYSAWHDPASVVGMRLRSALPQPDRLDIEPGWLEAWRAADAEAGETIAAELEDQLSEPLVAARLVEWMPADATLFVASSMPVRDVEEFSPVIDTPPTVLANRGANGIDGTVSTAFGVAAATGKPVVLLIGDVALLHDMGGLPPAKRLNLEPDSRAAQQRRRRDLPLPPSGRPKPTRSKTMWPRPTASISLTSPRSTDSSTSARSAPAT